MTFGSQVVKSVTLARPNILISIVAKFQPEEVMGVACPAGSVITNITLDPVNGKFKKVEKIQGGILSATIGNDTHTSEENCMGLSLAPKKVPIRVRGG